MKPPRLSSSRECPSPPGADPGQVQQRRVVPLFRRALLPNGLLLRQPAGL